MKPGLEERQRRALAALEIRARKLAGAIYVALKSDGWGAIDPTTFYNLGEDSDDPDDMRLGKLTQEEAEAAEDGMLRVLMEALTTLDEE
jgi:hypothetical protein